METEPTTGLHVGPSRPRVDDARLSIIAVAVGGVWILAYTSGLLGPVGTATFPVLALAAIVATFVGLHRYQPAVRWPWYALALGFALFIVGAVMRDVSHTVGVVSSRRALAPDLITISGYVVMAVGLFGFVVVRHRDRMTRIDAILDASVAALASLALAWAFLMRPESSLQHSPVSVRLIIATYPPLAAFMVALTAGLAFSTGRRSSVADKLRLAAMAFLLIGDVAYIFLETRSVTLPNFVDLPYALAYLAYIASVLHPSMAHQTEADVTVDRSGTIGRVTILALALSIPGMLAILRPQPTTADRIVLVSIVFTLTTVAILRMVRALRGQARSEAALMHQSEHDALTGLPNRVKAQRLVDEALAASSGDSNGDAVTLFLCDIDRFKLINDSHGHGVGDEFLLMAASRLRSCIRPSDVVARVGGDEFLLVATGIAEGSNHLEFADRICRKFNEPFDVQGIEVASSISVGVVVADPADANARAEDLIRDADTAVYQAKEAGRDAVVVFDRGMRDRVSHRLSLQRDLRHAVERNEFQLHYQPIVELPSGRLVGFEALLRWNHPTWGQISPLSFIPVAEDTGLIVEIGSWVLAESCRQLMEWRRTLPNGKRLEMSVNISARQLRDPEVFTRIGTTLRDFAVPEGALTLELTESTLMENPAAAANTLTRLKSLGVSLSIDDFGTGYSSLAYLRRFPVDHVKIDRAFVSGLDDEDSSDETLVAAIVAMADALGIRTVAEGVEEPTQAARLERLHVDRAQGYLYSRPAEASAIPGVIEQLSAAARGKLSTVHERFSA